MKVEKRSGKLQDYSPDRILANVERCVDELDEVSASEIVLDAKLQLYDGVKTTEIDEALILSARSKIYKEPQYSLAAARLLLNTLYKDVLGPGHKGSADTYKDYFKRYITSAVGYGCLDERMEMFHLDDLAYALDMSLDQTLRYHAVLNLKDRYLLRHQGNILELPQMFYMRVAMGLQLDLIQNDKIYDATKNAIELYEVYSNHLGMSSTPTLFNSGTTHSQLSSCYLSEIGDSIDGIFDGLWQEARKSKYAGGLGFHVGKIRANGADVKGTSGKSGGLIPWLKIYNDMLIAVDQGGRRRGSGCAYIEPWHLDVEEFIELRKVTGEERRRCHDLNIALWINDLFMERVEADADWTLMCPNDVEILTDLYGEKFKIKYEEFEQSVKEGAIRGKTIKAKELWKHILKALFSTSHPWITFKDRCNLGYMNQHAGVLHGSNLCTEITLHTHHSKYNQGRKTSIGETAVCNLGSINLGKMVASDGTINFDLMRTTVRTMVKALDSTIDNNFYPTSEAGYSNTMFRPIGLGTMGWSDFYNQLDILQDSQEAVQLASDIMEYISFLAINASNDLASEKGHYQRYDGSAWSQGKFPFELHPGETLERKYTKDVPICWNALRERVKMTGVRNSQILAIAPNASIAYQLGVEQSIEPIFSVLFTYENKSGKYFIVNEHFVREMKEQGLWNTSIANKVKELDGDISQLDIPINIKRKYCTAFQRDQFKLIEANAARQKWVDQAISFNLWNAKTSIKHIHDMYMHSWKCGLKTTYYLRNKPASTVSKVCSIDDKTCESCQG